jgi:hypothetical protein
VQALPLRYRAFPGPEQDRRMSITRQTFVIQVHDEDGSAVLENVRTQEVVRLHDLAELTPWIERWSNPTRQEGSDEAHRDDLRRAGDGPGRVRR